MFRFDDKLAVSEPSPSAFSYSLLVALPQGGRAAYLRGGETGHLEAGPGSAHDI